MPVPVRVAALIDHGEFEAHLAGCGAPSALDAAADRPLAPARPLVAAFAALIGDDDEMIAASYAFQFVIGRLAAPTLAGAFVLGCAPAFALDDVRWSAGRDGPTVGVARAPIRPTTPELALADLLAIVAVWADLVRAEVRIARRLLVGNAAAALLGVVRGVANLDQVDQARTARLSAAIIDAFGRPPVARLIDVDGWSTFQRRTCCLLRFAGARGVCDECSLLGPHDLLAAQRSVRMGVTGR